MYAHISVSASKPINKFRVYAGISKVNLTHFKTSSLLQVLTDYYVRNNYVLEPLYIKKMESGEWGLYSEKKTHRISHI